MAVEPLPEQLTGAGRAMLDQLDRVGLHPQGALWLMFPHIKDWRYTVISDLVDNHGRTQIYGLIDEALAGLDPVDGLTIFDIHLASTSEILPRVIGGAIHVENGLVQLSDCNINGVPVDAVVYRLQSERSLVERKKALKALQRSARHATA